MDDQGKPLDDKIVDSGFVSKLTANSLKDQMAVRQTVKILLGPDAYSRVYRPLPNVPGMIENVGEKAERMLLRGDDPGQIIRELAGSVGKDTYLPPGR